MLDSHSQVAPTIELALIRYLPDVEYQRSKRHSAEIEGRGGDREGSAASWEERGFRLPAERGNIIVDFGGVAGQAFTSAYVRVVIVDQRHAAVYLGGRFPYLVPIIYTLRNDNSSQTMRDVHLYRQRYGSLKSSEKPE